MTQPLVRLNDYARLGAAALTKRPLGKPSFEGIIDCVTTSSLHSLSTATYPLWTVDLIDGQWVGSIQPRFSVEELRQVQLRLDRRCPPDRAYLMASAPPAKYPVLTRLGSG